MESGARWFGAPAKCGEGWRETTIIREQEQERFPCAVGCQFQKIEWQ
jgi:hypothetical protein